MPLHTPQNQALVAADIAQHTGASEDVAQMAAGSYLAYPTAVGDWGLSPSCFEAAETRNRAWKAREALLAWCAGGRAAELDRAIRDMEAEDIETLLAAQKMERAA